MKIRWIPGVAAALFIAIIGARLAGSSPVPASDSVTQVGEGARLVPRDIRTYRNIGSFFATFRCIALSGNRLVLDVCAEVESQFWGPFHNGGNIYRFQNHATADCLWVDEAVSGLPAVTDECTLSDGSGNSVSNAEWDLGKMLVTTPNGIATTMRTRVGNRDSNLCLTANGNIPNFTISLSPCLPGPSNSQLWLIGAQD